MSQGHTVSKTLAGLPVFLSASLPDQLRGTARSQVLFDFIVPLVNGILSNDGLMVFGGHPTITPLMHQACVTHNFTGGRITLFQHRRFQSQAPPQVLDERVFKVEWVGDENASDEQFAEQLGEMRRLMAARAKSVPSRSPLRTSQLPTQARSACLEFASCCQRN